jgi:glutaredoxin 3
MPFVEIYTKDWCGYCARAKRLLREKGIDFQDHDITLGGPQAEEMVMRAKGRTSVPQIFIDGVHVGGCDDLMALNADGMLDRMLAPKG